MKVEIGDLVKITWFGTPGLVVDIDTTGKVPLVILTTGEEWLEGELEVISDGSR